MFSLGKKSNPASKSKSNEPTTGSKPKNLAQFGFLDMGFQAGDMAGGDSDEDLEAELAALTKGTLPSREKKTKKMISEKELAAMVSSSMADIPSDAEISDIDDAEVEDELGELCGSEDDPEPSEVPTNQVPSMNAEAIIKLLNERIDMYKTAENNAIKTGDTMKARRFNRGVKSLNDMLKQTLSGKVISIEDIPPPLADSNKTLPKAVPKEDIKITGNLDVSIPSNERQNPVPILPSKPMIPVRVAPLPPDTTPPPIPLRVSVPNSVVETAEQDPNGSVLTQSSKEIENAVARRQELKNAALQAKRAGEQAAALQFVRLVKVCDQMIDSAKQGLPVDWSCLPSVDVVESANSIPSEMVEKTSEKEEAVANPVIQNDIIPNATGEVGEPKMSPTVPSIPIPHSTLEALEQRLAKYKSIMQQAQEEGNSSKARRFGRIVKQYQDAIKLNKLGKPVPFDELPDPPGYPPIPGAPRKAEEVEGPLVAQTQPGEIAPSESTAMTPENPSALQPAIGPSLVISPKVSQSKTTLATRQDKQLAVLLERQSMFKTAALEAKKSGELDLAKEYLRMAKGMDPLISANKCGVPVDMDTLPIPPQMKVRPSDKKGIPSKSDSASLDDFVMISSDDHVPTLDANSSGIFGQLYADLLAQLKMCTDNREHYKLIGDIANANRFDQLAHHTRKDLDVIRSSAIRGDTIPRWKNEMRTFSIVKCCTDLKDDDMEVAIIRGLTYNVANPKTIDTYVRFEVPIPNTDNPTREKTNIVKDTNSPEYNETFHVNINRQSRTLLRLFKAKLVKFEVWAKGGFLRSDILIGTASLKLADLLNHCQIHEAVDLMDGRKPVGGKLEVKIRLRNPIVGKEMEQVQEKWTVLTY